MDYFQFLLCKGAEEASEVAQIMLKTQQFGRYERRPGQNLTNEQRVHAELNDLLAVVEMLTDDCGFDFQPDREAIEAKKKRVREYLALSVTLGAVQL